MARSGNPRFTESCSCRTKRNALGWSGGVWMVGVAVVIVVAPIPFPCDGFPILNAPTKSSWSSQQQQQRGLKVTQLFDVTHHPHQDSFFPSSFRSPLNPKNDRPTRPRATTTNAVSWMTPFQQQNFDVSRNATTTTTTTTAVEMAGMSAIGLAFSLGVIYILASTGGGSGGEGAGGSEETGRMLEHTWEHLVDASLPADTTDVVTIALGESIGGFIGAMSTSVVTRLLRLRMQVEQKSLLAEAVADGDYFLTRAATLPLLEAFGMPRAVASFGSVILATIPYELVMQGSRRRQQQLIAEDLMMEQLLQEQQRKERGFWSDIRGGNSKGGQKEEEKKQEIDIPEIFADVIKWLEYDVLSTDFGGTLLDFDGNPLPSSIESAIFGFITGLSTVLYLDIVRMYTDYGPKSKRVEARSRSWVDGVSLYATESLSAAALFGVYESARQPVSVFVADILSGGVDGCVGSSDFKGCVATYVENNAPEASFEAQVRSLVTTLVSVWDRLSVDGGYDSSEVIRAAAVQLNNIMTHAIPAIQQHYSTMPGSL